MWANQSVTPRLVPKGWRSKTLPLLVYSQKPTSGSRADGRRATRIQSLEVGKTSFKVLNGESLDKLFSRLRSRGSVFEVIVSHAL
jgi:hypothetical protein